MANRPSPKQKPPLGAVMNGSHPLSQGLVGWWLFNEQGGTKANDISGRNNTGTLTGGPTWNNQALSFDGVNDYVSVPYSVNHSFGTGDFTLSAWINASTYGDYDRVLTNYRANTNGRQGFTFTVNSGILRGYIGNGSTDISGATTLQAGTWYHVMLVREGDTAKLYLNGVQDGSTVTGFAARNVTSDGMLDIGAETENSSHFSGSLDDVRIYNRALSANEVRMLYETPYANIARVNRRIIAASGASVVTSGTLPSSTEANVVAGGRTLILTLTGDTWVAAGATFNAQRQAIINGITSAQAEAFGWNAVPKVLQAVAGVVRTSDTVVTITWDAFPTYDISATETITATIPGAALTGGSAIVATPTFSITPVLARRAFVFDNGTRLTNGRIPYSVGSNRLADESSLSYNASTDTLTVVNVVHTGSSIFKSVTDAGPMTATNGTVGEIVFNTSNSKFYGCTATGTPATWAALN